MKTKRLTLRLYRDKKREFRWTLIASNGRKLADSGEGYKRKKKMELGAFTALAGVFDPCLCEKDGSVCWQRLLERRSDIRVDDAIEHGKAK